jgi:hypothetical protein
MMEMRGMVAAAAAVCVTMRMKIYRMPNAGLYVSRPLPPC